MRGRGEDFGANILCGVRDAWRVEPRMDIDPCRTVRVHVPTRQRVSCGDNSTRLDAGKVEDEEECDDGESLSRSTSSAESGNTFSSRIGSNVVSGDAVC